MRKLILKHERTSLRVTPHYVPAKLLLPMWRKDHSPALASLDESEVLRWLYSAVPSRALAVVISRDCHSLVPRFYFRSCSEAEPTAIGYPTKRTYAGIITTNCTGYQHISDTVVPGRGTGLHLRRAHKERHAVLPSRAWSGTLLAAQRYVGNAASR